MQQFSNTSTFDAMFDAAPENTQPANNQPQSLDQQNSIFPASNDIPAESTFDPLNPVPQQKPQNNDEVRYNYWQSQADKLAKEKEELIRKTAEQEAMLRQYQQPPQQQAQAPQVEQEERFPDFNIPEPVKPYNFSIQEAYTDPNSESARYLAEKDMYRDQQLQYNSLKTQYVEAKAKEYVTAMEGKLKQTQSQFNERYEVEQKVNAIVGEVQSKFNVSRDVAQDFVKVMGDNSMYTLDNMWKFYQAQQMPANNIPRYAPQAGYQPQAMYNQNTYQPPSPVFNQYQRAQSIPNIMNVSSQSNDVDSPMRQLMLSQIQNQKKSNMFG